MDSDRYKQLSLCDLEIEICRDGMFEQRPLKTQHMP
jgi:hypothetical protein